MRWILCLSLFVAGCSQSLPAGQFDSAISSEIAMASVQNAVLVTPVTGQCPNCKGVGKVGDGVTMIKCPVCDGTGKAASRPTVTAVAQQLPGGFKNPPEKPATKFVDPPDTATSLPANERCCVDCKCANCTCKYVGECVCKANGNRLSWIKDPKTGAWRGYAPPDAPKTAKPPVKMILPKSANYQQNSGGSCANGNCGSGGFRFFGRGR